MPSDPSLAVDPEFPILRPEVAGASRNAPPGGVIPLRALLFLVATAACGPGSTPTDAGPDVVRGPNGEPGICCPIDMGSCDGFRNGGWARSLDQCPLLFDAAPPTRLANDPYGCPMLYASGSCLVPPDAGAGRD